MALPEEPPARLRVGVVGAGRVGTVLAAALARAGHTVVAVTSGSPQSQRRVDQLLPGVPSMAADEVVAASDLVLLTVPDDVLRDLVAGLAATDAWPMGQLLVHTSGAHGIGVLDAAAARGVIPLALHPAMTFTGRREDLDRLSGATFGVTAQDEMRPVAETLVYEMGADPVWVPELARPIYHAALTTGANHLVTLVNDALDLLTRAGVEQPAQVIAPLLSAALDNVLRLGDAALTGPVSRGDAATVATHVATLRAQAPEQVSSYIAMARRTTERARASGRLNAEQAAALEAVLR
jgi:predicted short-subunit dehydrogenase-like oxidoreductase (DUF2520 family)